MNHKYYVSLVKKTIMKITHYILALLFLSASSFFISCKSLRTAYFDHYSFQKSIAIKIDAMRLMDKATTAYSEHSYEIEKIRSEIEKITEYERFKPNNEITYKMWLILGNEDKNLLTGFLKYWKNKGKLSKPFIEEAKKQLTEAMDLLIQYEGKKETNSKQNLLNFIKAN